MHEPVFQLLLHCLRVGHEPFRIAISRHGYHSDTSSRFSICRLRCRYSTLRASCDFKRPTPQVLETLPKRCLTCMWQPLRTPLFPLDLIRMLHYGLGGNSGHAWAVDVHRAVVRHERDSRAMFILPLLPQGFPGPQPEEAGAPQVENYLAMYRHASTEDLIHIDRGCAARIPHPAICI
jgi:hypothetical protein